MNKDKMQLIKLVTKEWLQVLFIKEIEVFNQLFILVVDRDLNLIKINTNHIVEFQNVTNEPEEFKQMIAIQLSESLKTNELTNKVNKI